MGGAEEVEWESEGVRLFRELEEVSGEEWDLGLQSPKYRSRTRTTTTFQAAAKSESQNVLVGDTPQALELVPKDVHSANKAAFEGSLNIRGSEKDSSAIGLDQTPESVMTQSDGFTAHMEELEREKKNVEANLEGLDRKEENATNVRASLRGLDIALKKREQELAQQKLALHVRHWELEQRQRELTREHQQSLNPDDPPQFSGFTDLPTELRRKIWGCTVTSYIKDFCDFDRLHSIRAIPYGMLESKPSYQTSFRNLNDPDQVKIDHRYGVGGYDRVAYLSQHGVPPTLQVCREARYYLLQKYSLVPAFGTLVNFSTDLIFLDWSECFGEDACTGPPGNAAIAYLTTLPEVTKEIKHLALPGEVGMEQFQDRARLLRRYLGNLETLTFIVDDGRESHWDAKGSALRSEKNLDLVEYTSEGYLRYHDQPTEEGKFELLGKWWMECMEFGAASPVICYSSPYYSDRAFFGAE